MYNDSHWRSRFSCIRLHLFVIVTAAACSFSRVVKQSIQHTTCSVKELQEQFFCVLMAACFLFFATQVLTQSHVLHMAKCRLRPLHWVHLYIQATTGEPVVFFSVKEVVKHDGNAVNILTWISESEYHKQTKAYIRMGHAHLLPHPSVSKRMLALLSPLHRVLQN